MADPAGQRALGQRNGGGQGQGQPERQRHRHELGLAWNAARNDAPAGEGVDARDGVGHERGHERRAVRPIRPLQRGGDAVLEPVAPIGETRGLGGGQSHEETRDGARDSPHGETGRGPREPHHAQGVAQDERDEGSERAQEQAAEPVELRAPDPDFPADAGHCALKYREIGHAPSSTP